MVQDLEQQVFNKLAGIQAMVTELNFRIGSNPYSSMQFDRMNIGELDHVSGELSEMLYGDPDMKVE